MRIDADRTFRKALERGPSAATSLIPRDYLDAVGAIKDFVLYYRPLLDREESRLAGRVNSDALLRDLAERSFQAMRDTWRQLVVDASKAGWALRTNPVEHRAAKRFTEATVTPLLLGCPLIGRTWNKPLGYAGDYVVMEYYYRDAFEGASVFDQVMHRLFVQNPMAKGVVTRARFIVDTINREHERISPDGKQGFA
ncbi:MAG: hypothetical protein WBG86_14845, partial [Polyangiales bacterium]